jgi:hypothetical protein
MGALTRDLRYAIRSVARVHEESLVMTQLHYTLRQLRLRPGLSLTMIAGRTGATPLDPSAEGSAKHEAFAPNDIGLKE